MESVTTANKDQEFEYFAPTTARIFIILILFAAALGVRLYKIADPPLDFNITRQYHSLIITRKLYFENLTKIPEQRKELAKTNEKNRAFVEPRITEYLTSRAYHLFGGEYFWVSRLFTTTFWLFGGLFLYLLARNSISHDAAIFSAAFYLFLPYGVSASRSFQPDSLMVMMLLVSILTIYRYHSKPVMVNLILAGVVSGLAIMVKVVCIFVIFGSFISLNVYRHGIKRAFINLNLVIFAGLSFLPFTLYFLYGYFVLELLKGEVQGRIVPQLWLSKHYWGGWLNQIEKTVGYIALAVGVFGVSRVRSRLPRALLIGLWGGYFVFGLTFTYHICSHTYYQLQLIPIIALSLGSICTQSFNHLKRNSKPVYCRVFLLLTLLLLISLNLYKTRRRIAHSGFEHKVKVAEEIGEIVSHSPKTIFLAPNYGSPLLYHGEISGKYWPQSWETIVEKLNGQNISSVEDRLNYWSTVYSPDYFIVTDLKDFETQKDLKELLFANFPVVANSGDYVIFKLDQPIIAN
jgi:hypothetical protein